MKNIYDLFEERKAEVYGVAYESLDVALEDLDRITSEYLDVECIIEATEEEGQQKTSFKDKIHEWWEKIKRWFLNVIKTIKMVFKDGETVVRENKRHIPGAIKNSKTRVKGYKFNDPNKALKTCDSALYGISWATNIISLRKFEGAVKYFDVNSVEEFKEKITLSFMGSKEPTEFNVSDLDPSILLAYADSENVINDIIKKQNYYSKNIEGNADRIKDDGDRSEYNKALNLFKDTISTMINCVKKAHNDSVAIIKKALAINTIKGGNHNAEVEGDGKTTYELGNFMKSGLTKAVQKEDKRLIQIYLKNALIDEVMDRASGEYNACVQYMKSMRKDILDVIMEPHEKGRHELLFDTKKPEEITKEDVRRACEALMSNFSSERIADIKRAIKLLTSKK